MSSNYQQPDILEKSEDFSPELRLADRVEFKESEYVEPVMNFEEDPEFDEIKFESNTGMIDFSKQLHNEYNYNQINETVEYENNVDPYINQELNFEKPNEIVISQRNESFSNSKSITNSDEKKSKGSKFERFRQKASKVNHKKTDHKESSNTGYYSDNQAKTYGNQIPTQHSLYINTRSHRDFNNLEYESEMQEQSESFDRKSEKGYNHYSQYQAIDPSSPQKKGKNAITEVNQYVYKCGDGETQKVQAINQSEITVEEDKNHKNISYNIKINEPPKDSFIKNKPKLVIDINSVNNNSKHVHKHETEEVIKYKLDMATNYEEEIQEEVFKTYQRRENDQDIRKSFLIDFIKDEEKVINLQKMETVYCSIGSESMINEAENNFSRDDLPNKLIDKNLPNVTDTDVVACHDYRRESLNKINSISKKDQATECDLLTIKEILIESRQSISDINMAIYYIKCMSRAAKIVELHDFLYSTLRVLDTFDAILRLFDFERILILNVISALSNLTYQNHLISDEILNCKFWHDIIEPQKVNEDENMLKFFAFLLTNMSYKNENVKVRLVNEGIAQILDSQFKLACKIKMMKGLSYTLSAIANLVTIKEICSVQIFEEKKNFYVEFISSLHKFINDREITKSALMVFQNILKNVSKQEMDKLINNGLSSYLQSVFLKWKTEGNDDIMHQFLFCLGEAGWYETLWNNLERSMLSKYIIENLLNYNNVIINSALSCLWHLTKIESIADNVVFRDDWRKINETFWKDWGDEQANITSLVLLISSNLVWSKKRQDHLNNKNYARNVQGYFPRVWSPENYIEGGGRNDTLLLVWANLMLKLTNNPRTCELLVKEMPDQIWDLIEKYYDTPFFDKIYNLVSNVCLGYPIDTQFTQKTLDISLRKAAESRSKMFFVNFAHFQENGFALNDYLLKKSREKRDVILKIVENLPIIAKPKEDVIRDYLVPGGRRETKILGELWSESKIKADKVAEMTDGVNVQRFRQGGAVEKGQVYTTNDKICLIFQRDDWISFDMIEDRIQIDGFVKVVKGFDKKDNAYHQAMKKYQQKIKDNCCLTIYGKKTTIGESGFYLGFESKERRDNWYETLMTMNKENVKKIEEEVKSEKKKKEAEKKRKEAEKEELKKMSDKKKKEAESDEKKKMTGKGR